MAAEAWWNGAGDFAPVQSHIVAALSSSLGGAGFRTGSGGVVRGAHELKVGKFSGNGWAGFPQPSTEWVRSTLKWTNTFRAIHGAPPVTWSWKAWENAALAAEACRERQELFHSNHRGYGQNGYACAVRQVDGPVPLKELMSVEDWTGTGPGDDQNSPEVAIRCWYDEHRNYDWHEPGSSRSGVVSHFTQLVWAKTRKVGLARSSCGTFLMMNFDPPGNIIGVNTYSRNVRPIDRSKQEAFWMEEEARAAAVAAKDAVAIEAAKKSRAAKVAKGVLEHEKRSERAGRWAEIHQRVSRAEAAAASDARLSIELMQARARRSKAELDEADRALQQAQAAQQAAKARYDRDARELAGEVRLAERRLRCHIGLLERKEELLPCTEAELDQSIDTLEPASFPRLYLKLVDRVAGGSIGKRSSGGEVRFLSTHSLAPGVQLEDVDGTLWSEAAA
eukprot:g3190.t1